IIKGTINGTKLDATTMARFGNIVGRPDSVQHLDYEGRQFTQFYYCNRGLVAVFDDARDSLHSVKIHFDENWTPNCPPPGSKSYRGTLSRGMNSFWRINEFLEKFPELVVTGKQTYGPIHQAHVNVRGKDTSLCFLLDTTRDNYITDFSLGLG